MLEIWHYKGFQGRKEHESDYNFILSDRGGATLHYGMYGVEGGYDQGCPEHMEDYVTFFYYKQPENV